MDCFVWCYCHISNQYFGLNLEENRTKTMKQATSPVCLVLIACQVSSRRQVEQNLKKKH